MPRRVKPELKASDIAPPPFDVLYGKRDPAEERLVSALMLAGEKVATELDPRPPIPGEGEDAVPPPTFATPEGSDGGDPAEDCGGLAELVTLIRARLAQDARLSSLLARLPVYFGDGDLLRAVFRNFYPAQKTEKTLNADGSPILTKREVEVLRETAGGRPEREIAARLGVSHRTVTTHFANIYRKLGVNRPMPAVARAVAMGYLDIDAYDALTDAAGSHPHNFGLFRTLLLLSGSCREPDTSALEPLAGLGLLLLALTGSATQSVRQQRLAQTVASDIVCQFNTRGEMTRSFGLEGLRLCGGIAVAPPHAAMHGFTPGSLFVAVRCDLPQGLNQTAIAELTPEGRYIRSFCGGREIGTRMVEGNSLAFAADGRLLVMSGVLTDAILTFSAGGAKVRRFADGNFYQIAVHPSGKVYGTQYSSMGCVIKVFDADGLLAQTMGGTPAGSRYLGIAITSRGHIFVSRENGSWTIALDAEDRLYVPCMQTADVKVLSPDGVVERCIDLRGKVRPAVATVGTGGQLWVCGKPI
jgi:DNA-binding CsgD family transcriptional regulator